MTKTFTEFTNNFAVMDMRHAFERDMVRRGKFVASHSVHVIMIECDVCGEPFERGHWKTVTCSDKCKREKKRQVDLKWWHRNKPAEEEKELDPANATGDQWLNLVLAIAQDAEERDEWLEIYEAMRRGVEIRTATMI